MVSPTSRRPLSLNCIGAAGPRRCSCRPATSAGPIVGNRGRHGGTARRLMDWSTIADLAAAGVDFGGHGVTHRDLTQFRGAELADEVLVPKRMIEERLSRPVASFAAPFGRIRRRGRRAGPAVLPTGGRDQRWPGPDANRIRTRSRESRCGISGSPAAGRAFLRGDAQELPSGPRAPAPVPRSSDRGAAIGSHPRYRAVRRVNHQPARVERMGSTS